VVKEITPEPAAIMGVREEAGGEREGSWRKGRRFFRTTKDEWDRPSTGT